MGELWKAFVARLVYLLTPKPVVPTEMLKSFGERYEL